MKTARSLLAVIFLGAGMFFPLNGLTAQPQQDYEDIITETSRFSTYLNYGRSRSSSASAETSASASSASPTNSQVVGGIYAVSPTMIWKMIWPVDGRISSHFGLRRGSPHNGIDVAADWGSPVLASQSGTVVAVDILTGYGRHVKIDHGDGVTTLYAHLDSYSVSLGDVVERGQKIGEVGCTGTCTGPHVHFELRFNDKPVNPYFYLP